MYKTNVNILAADGLTAIPPGNYTRKQLEHVSDESLAVLMAKSPPMIEKKETKTKVVKDG